MEFQVLFHQGNQRYYWRIDASNGRVLASSEAYFNRQDCYNAVSVVKTYAGTARVVDATKAA